MEENLGDAIMPQDRRIPWAWFDRIMPELAQSYPNKNMEQLMEVGAGIYHKQFDPNQQSESEEYRQYRKIRGRPMSEAQAQKKYLDPQPTKREVSRFEELQDEMRDIKIGMAHMERFLVDHPDDKLTLETIASMKASLERKQAEFEKIRAKFDPQVARAMIRHGRGALRTARRGAGLLRRIPRPRIRRAKATVRPIPEVKPAAKRGIDPRLYADPARLPPPKDYAGYDNLNLVRLVEKADKPGFVPVKHLIEGQIVLPAHQWNDVYSEVKDWKDVEITDEDHDNDPDRIIRRGRKNYQTNLFIDKA